MGDEAEQMGSVHVAGPGEAEAVVVGQETRAAGTAAEQAGPVIEGAVAEVGLGAGGGEGLRGLSGDAKGAQAVAPASFDQQAADHGVEVHVLVGVGVIEAEAGGGKSGELGLDLGGELAAGARGDVAQAEAELVGGESTAGGDEAGDLGWGKRGLAFDGDEMQAELGGRGERGPGG